MPRTSHVTTIPQSRKAIATRKRHLELRRRDKTIAFRKAWNDDWNDARKSFIDRTAGWDSLDAPTAAEIDEELATAEFYQFMLTELLAEIDATPSIEPETLACGCIETCAFDCEAEYIATEALAFYDQYPEFLNDSYAGEDLELEDDDPHQVDDFGGYQRIHGTCLVKSGSGFGLDSVFGEGYLGGNCGFSVRTRP